MSEKILISKSKLETFLSCFEEVSSLCNEMDIYEFEEGNQTLQKCKSWVEDNINLSKPEELQNPANELNLDFEDEDEDEDEDE